MRNPDNEPSRNVELSSEQMTELLEMLLGFTPEVDRDAWDALAAGLERELEAQS